ncbi:MAG: hypothetical protein QXP29_03365 [Candidatus Nezhaarchaeales archaeon]
MRTAQRLSLAEASRNWAKKWNIRLGRECMIGQIREGCYRVIYYFQKIKSLVRKGRKTSLQEQATSTSNVQHLESGVSKVVKSRRAKKSRKSATKRPVVKKRSRGSRKRRAKKGKR